MCIDNEMIKNMNVLSSDSVLSMLEIVSLGCTWFPKKQMPDEMSVFTSNHH